MSEMNPAAELSRFDVLVGVDVTPETITIASKLPDQGAGYNTNDLRRWFKESLHEWLLANAAKVKGRTVRFSGPNTLPATLYAGIAVAKLGAASVQVSERGGGWLTVAAHNDPEAPLPVVYEPGHVVRARAFGHEVSGLVIRAASLGGQFQICARENREQVWIGNADVLSYEGVIPPREENIYAEQPKYRRPRGSAPNMGATVRFQLFGRNAEGRVTATRPNSFNAVHECGHVASLVPIDNII